MSQQTPPAASRRWLGLAVIAAAQFMVIMDTSIIGVTLPKMQADLGFSPENLSWVFNAYVIALGGLLLLGGRLSDILGARRVFSAGWVVLIAGSLVAGLAGNTAAELAGRALQGAGSARPGSRCGSSSTSTPSRSSATPPFLPAQPCCR